MATLFNTIIKTKKNDLGIASWYIELVDTLDARTEICNDLEEYEKAVIKLGDDYGGDIEVVWTQDEDVTSEMMYDIKVQMDAFQEKYKDEINKFQKEN
jgi:ERCC4-type nuclease